MKDFDVIVIGAGITGAGVFRDLALHGVSCLLLDKGDFTASTSQSSSKMLHGGIRYLENFDFELVQEALHEKNLWLKLLPHLAKEVPFVLPNYKESKYPLFMLKIGLLAYDFLSGFQNSPHKILGKNETIKQRPLLSTKNLRGSGLYYDALMDDAKITLEVIYDALKEQNAFAMNYHEVTNVVEEGSKHIVQTKNLIKNTEDTFIAKKIIYCLGPYTDKFLKNTYPNNWTPQLLPSKGSHIWVSKEDFNLSDPCVINHKDGRVIFFIPHETQILIGTTEEPLNEEINDIKISQKEITYLLSIIKEYYPKVNIKQHQIESAYSGVRPLIKSNLTNDQGKTARTHRTYQISNSVQAIAGGKYTTFRVMAQESVGIVCEQLGVSYSKSKTIKKLRQKSCVIPFERKQIDSSTIKQILSNEMPKTLEDLVHRRIGVNSLSQWKSIYPENDFNNFFLENIELINQYFPLKKEEIINYFKD